MTETAHFILMIVYRYKTDVDGLMKACFKGSSVPRCFKNYMSSVYRLGYQEQPDYEMLKGLFHRELHSKGMKDDGTGLDWLTSRKVAYSLLLSCTCIVPITFLLSLAAAVHRGE